MIIFSPKNTQIFRSVKWGEIFVFKFSKNIRNLFFFLTFLFLLIFIYSFVGETATINIQKLFLGSFFVCFSLFSFFFNINIFLNQKIKKPKLKIKLKDVLKRNDINLADFVSYEVAKSIKSSIKFAKSKEMTEISSSLLFYFLIKENSNLNFIFLRLSIPVKKVKSILRKHFSLASEEEFLNSFSEGFKKTILLALDISKKQNHNRIEIYDIIFALAKEDLIFKKIMADILIKESDIENLSWWLEDIEKRKDQKNKFWSVENLRKKGIIGRDWASGFTTILNKFSSNITEISRKMKYPRIIGHQEEIKKIEKILSEEKNNNILLVGDLGSGRKSIIEYIATKIALGTSLSKNNYKKLIKLDLTLLSQIKDIEKIILILSKIFEEVSQSGNIILVIDNFHLYLKNENDPLSLDIENIIIPYLNLPQFQLIAITDSENSYKYIESNESLFSLFQKVNIFEVSKEETLMILERIIPILENKYKIFVPFKTILAIINYCENNILNTPFPEKAINLLNKVTIYTKENKEKTVLPEHIEKALVKNS